MDNFNLKKYLSEGKLLKEEMDCVEEFRSKQFASKEELSKWLVLTCGDYGTELICQELWGEHYDIDEDGFQSAIWDLEEWYEENIGFGGEKK